MDSSQINLSNGSKSVRFQVNGWSTSRGGLGSLLTDCEPDRVLSADCKTNRADKSLNQTNSASVNTF